MILLHLVFLSDGTGSLSHRILGQQLLGLMLIAAEMGIVEFSDIHDDGLLSLVILL